MILHDGVHTIRFVNGCVRMAARRSTLDTCLMLTAEACSYRVCLSQLFVAQRAVYQFGLLARRQRQMAILKATVATELR